MIMIQIGHIAGRIVALASCQTAPQILVFKGWFFTFNRLLHEIRILRTTFLVVLMHGVCLDLSGIVD